MKSEAFEVASTYQIGVNIMKNSFVKSGIAMGLFLIALTGCSDDPETTADVMRDDASEGQAQVDMKKQIAKDWERGKEMIASGAELVEEGAEQVESAQEEFESGQKTIEHGEQKIAEGQKLVNESERKFQELYPGVDLNQTN